MQALREHISKLCPRPSVTPGHQGLFGSAALRFKPSTPKLVGSSVPCDLLHEVCLPLALSHPPVFLCCPTWSICQKLVKNEKQTQKPCLSVTLCRLTPNGTKKLEAF